MRQARGAATARSTTEGAQLMLLAGILLTLAFLVTALALLELSGERGEVVGAGRSTLREEFAYLRREFGASLNGSLPMGATNATLRSVFNDTRAAFRGAEASRGYEFEAALAGNGTLSPKTEWANFTTADQTAYDATSWDGRKSFAAYAYDGVSDGILHANGSVQGVLAYLLLADASTTYAEVLVYDALP